MIKKILYVLLVLCTTVNIFAVTKTASSGEWNTLTWSPAGIPVAGDDVLIPSGISVTTTATLSTFNSITLSGDLTVDGGSLIIAGGKTVTVKSGGVLNINGSNNLVLNNNNSILTVEQNAEVLITGNLTGNPTLTHYINNDGFIEILGNFTCETAILHNNTNGNLLLHGTFTAGSSMNIFNYGVIETYASVTTQMTNLYNFSSGKIFVNGDLTIANSGTAKAMYNYGLIQCNNFNISDKQFVNDTCSANLIGTISTNSSSNIITGTGTTFTSQLSVGNSITRSNDCFTLGTIASITDDTHLVLSCNATSTENNINYSYSINGTIITLSSFNATSSSCPGCTHIPSPTSLSALPPNDVEKKISGNIYYNSYSLGGATVWCNSCGVGQHCDTWFLSQSGFSHITPGRRIWLASDYLGFGTGSNNMSVKRWFDLANNFGFDLSESNSLLQPVLKNNLSDNINYNPVMSFDGGEKHLDLDTRTLFSTAANGGMAYFAVVKPSISGSTTPLICDFGNNTSAGYGFGYSNVQSYLYTPTASNGAVTSIAHTRGSLPTLVSMTVSYGAGGTQTVYHNGNSAGTTNLGFLVALDDAQIDQSVTPTGSSGPFTLGGKSADPTAPAFDFDGKLAELIVFAINVNQTTRYSNESYLALKYGITLNHDYLDYKGSAIPVWSYDVNYGSDIIGLAREDLNVLNQKISTSVNNPDELVLTTNEFASFNKIDVLTGIEKNSSYLICGHNGELLSSGNRIYKVQSTNFGQQIKMRFKSPGQTCVPVLVISDNSSFTGNILGVSGTTDGTYLYYSGINFKNTQYFKLLIPTISSTPGILISETAPLPTIKNTAELQIYSKSKGVLIPKMTTAQMSPGIASPANGLLIFNTDINRFMYYNGSNWNIVGGLIKYLYAQLSTVTGVFKGQMVYVTDAAANSVHDIWYWDGTRWNELQ